MSSRGDSSTPWNIGLPLYERAQRNPKVLAMLEEQVQEWQKWIIAVLQQSRRTEKFLLT